MLKEALSFQPPPRLDSLFYNFLLYRGLSLGKKIFVGNAMFSSCPASGENIAVKNTTVKLLDNANLVCTRDPFSLQYIRGSGFAGNGFFLPDALFSWSLDQSLSDCDFPRSIREIEPFPHEQFDPALWFDLDKPYVCVSGSSRAAWDQINAFHAYVNLVKAIKKSGLRVLLVPTCAGDRFLNNVSKETGTSLLPVTTSIRAATRVLMRSMAFVSGRFHPSILASLGGVPLILMGSNSHKTSSLQLVLGNDDPIEYNHTPSENDILKILADLKGLQRWNYEARKSMVLKLGNEALNVPRLIEQFI